MGEGGAARGGVAELLALVAVGDALVDGEDVPGVQLSNKTSRNFTVSPFMALSLLKAAFTIKN